MSRVGVLQNATPNMHDALTAPWWTWDPQSAGLWDRVYRGFNLIEAAAWFVFAALVLARWARHRRSGLEIIYGLAFLAFGLTDVAEAWRQSAWLVALKGAVLAALVWLRHVVRTRWYATNRLY